MITTAALACSIAPPETQVIEDTFFVGAASKLVVSIDNGGINITANPTENQTVQITATVRQPDRVEYSAKQEGDTIRIVGRVGDGLNLLGGNQGGIDVEVSLPANVDLALESSNGQIAVDGIKGSVQAKTSNGRVSVSNSTGKFEVETSNGRLELMDIEGQVKAQTSNGSVSYRGTLRPGSENRLHTSNGSIDVSLINIAGVELEAATSNGDVESSLPITVTGEIKEDELKGTIGDGSSKLEVTTSNGSITIQ